MKKALLLITIAVSSHSFAKVRNGYSQSVNARYYAVTEQAIAEFKRALPEAFALMDGLKEDVMVKVVPSDAMPEGTVGQTIAWYSAGKSVSEYGDNTLSVKIIESKRMYAALAHEFGHAYYQATYPEYYEWFQARYNEFERSHPATLGHASNDLSGAMAHSFEKQYKQAVRDEAKGR